MLRATLDRARREGMKNSARGLARIPGPLEVDVLNLIKRDLVVEPIVGAQRGLLQCRAAVLATCFHGERGWQTKPRRRLPAAFMSTEQAPRLIPHSRAESPRSYRIWRVVRDERERLWPTLLTERSLPQSVSTAQVASHQGLLRQKYRLQHEFVHRARAREYQPLVDDLQSTLSPE